MSAMDREEFRRGSLESWQTMAAGWERRRAEVDDILAPVRDWLLRELAPQPGETILELAAGPGDTGFSAAPQLGDDGLLITSDFSPAMLEASRRRADELGLRNVDFRLLDALELDLEDDAVDGVVCRFGFMLMADAATALSETRRVLRPGGRLVLAVWRGPEQNPWVAIAGRILAEHGLMPTPEPGAPGMFTLGSDERLLSLLDEAGFADVRLGDVSVRFVYDDVDDFVSVSREMGGAFRSAFESASPEQQAEIVEELRAAFSPFTTADGLELPGVALVALAR
jgi:ubiquinone/menaquinone biosynthesis C-methylase UbiE